MDKMGKPIDFLDNANVGFSLFAGKLSLLGYNDVGETFGSLSLEGGANTVEIRSSHGSGTIPMGVNIHFAHFNAATLNLISERSYIPSMSKGNNVSFFLPDSSQSYFLGSILPWATVGGVNWATYSANAPFSHPLHKLPHRRTKHLERSTQYNPHTK